ncbi:MAG: hypothetical protein ACTSWL_10110, partial [Promethearchaeota archaeon]
WANRLLPLKIAVKYTFLKLEEWNLFADESYLNHMHLICNTKNLNSSNTITSRDYITKIFAFFQHYLF